MPDDEFDEFLEGFEEGGGVTPDTDEGLLHKLGRGRKRSGKGEEASPKKQDIVHQLGGHPLTEVPARDILRHAAIRFIFELQYKRKKTLPQEVLDLYLETATKDDIGDALVAMQPNPAELIGLKPEELAEEVERLVPGQLYGPREKKGWAARKKHPLTPQVFATGERRGRDLLRRKMGAVFNPLMFYQPYGTVEWETGIAHGVRRVMRRDKKKIVRESLQTAKEAKPLPMVRRNARYTGIRIGCIDGPADLLVAGDVFFLLVHGGGRVEVLDVSPESGHGAALRKNDFLRLIHKLVMTKLDPREREAFSSAIPRYSRSAIIPRLPGKSEGVKEEVEEQRDFGGPALPDIIKENVQDLLTAAAAKRDELTGEYESKVNVANWLHLRILLGKCELKQTDLKLFQRGGKEIPRGLLKDIRSFIPKSYTPISASFDISLFLMQKKQRKEIMFTGMGFEGEKQYGKHGTGPSRGTYRLFFDIKSGNLIIAPHSGRFMVYGLDRDQKERFSELLSDLTELAPEISSRRDSGGPIAPGRGAAQGRAAPPATGPGAPGRGAAPKRAAPHAAAPATPPTGAGRDAPAERQSRPRRGMLNGALTHIVTRLLLRLASIRGALRSGYSRKVYAANDDKLLDMLVAVRVRQTDLSLFAGGSTEMSKDIVAGLINILPPVCSDVVAAHFDIRELFNAVEGEKWARRTGITLDVDMGRLGSVRYRLYIQGNDMVMSAGRGPNEWRTLDSAQATEFSNIMLQLTRVEAVPSRTQAPPLADILQDVAKDFAKRANCDIVSLLNRLKDGRLKQSDLEMFPDGKEQLPSEAVDVLKDLFKKERTLSDKEKYDLIIDEGYPLFDVSKLFSPVEGEKSTRHTGIGILAFVGIERTWYRRKYWLCVREDRVRLMHVGGHHIMFDNRLDTEQKRTFRDILRRLTTLKR